MTDDKGTDPTKDGASNGAIKRIAFIGSYQPRQCGIATFTTDLCEAVAAACPETACIALPVNDHESGYEYPPRVRFEMAEKDIHSYRRAADFLNINNIDLICLEHEYGIFGGRAGSHILALLQELRMPIVTTLHTILKDPDPDQLRVLKEIAALSDRLVVMTGRGVQFLQEVYGISIDKIDLIPHGIPDVPFVDPSFHKDLFGVEGKTVLLSFGLLSANKGIENVINALPAVLAKHPNVVYIILGATHPHVLLHEGESYRLSLQWLAQEKGVEGQVIFYNRFVSLEELVKFISAADIYITPYLNPAQITSGTLAYTLGAGKAVISTPYWYAEEMLAEERGVLVPFHDPSALAAQVIDLIDNEAKRHAMRKRAYLFGRSMIWPQVARRIEVALVPRVPIDVGACIDRTGQDVMKRRVGGCDPAKCGVRVGLEREGEPLGAEPQPHAAHGAQLGEALEDGPDRARDGRIGMEPDLAVRLTPEEPHRQAPPQLAPRGLVADAALEAGAQDVELGFRHRALEAEHEAVVEQGRMIEPVAIADQGVRHAAEVQEAIPVGVVAGEAGHLQAEHEADVAQRHLRRQLREPRARDHARARSALIFIDHHDMRAGPAQLQGAGDEIVLPVGRFAIALQLRGRGLPHVDEGGPAQVGGLDVRTVSHRGGPPRPGSRRDRRPWRSLAPAHARTPCARWDRGRPTRGRSDPSSPASRVPVACLPSSWADRPRSAFKHSRRRSASTMGRMRSRSATVPIDCGSEGWCSGVGA